MLSQEQLARLPDKVIRRERAILGLEDSWYLGSEIVGLSKDEMNPRPEYELRPVYEFLSREIRPVHLSPKDLWLMFLSMSRFTAKSYCLLVVMMQEIIRDVNTSLIYQSQQKQMASDGAKLIKEWLEIPAVVDLYGEFKSGDWGKEEFIISQRTKPQKDPTFRSMGLDDPLQGKRCRKMGIDDIVGDTNNTEDGLRKAENRFDASLPVVHPGGTVWWLCTRWNPYDMTSAAHTVQDRPGIIRQFNVSRETGTPCAWDCPPPRGFFGAYAVDGDQEFFPNAVPGEPLFPSVLDESKIDWYRKQMLPAVFASQILNDPIPEETRRFSAKDFQYFKARKPDGTLSDELIGAIPFMAVDPASARKTSSRTTSDESTFAVVFVKWFDNGGFNIFVVDWEGGRWRSDRVQGRVFSLYEEWRPRWIYPEVNVGGAYFLDPIRVAAKEKGIHLPIDEITASLHGTGKKAQRIDAIVQYYVERRVYHDEKLRNGRGEMQLLTYNGDYSGHDDFADVLAHAILESTKKRQMAFGKPLKRMSMALDPNF